MKAAVLRSFGSPPRYGDFPDPVVADGEVLIKVRAAALHAVVRTLADGSHYGAVEDLPVIVGVDGAGRLDDGTPVFFGGVRPPYGTMAELASAPRKICVPLPEGLDEITAAAALNPGLSGWLALTWRAALQRGECALVLGATGVAGHLAVQACRLLGAGRVVAAGRNKAALTRLSGLGATALVDLDGPFDRVRDALAAEASIAPFDVVIDYLWGEPTEALIAALERRGLTHTAPRTRLVQVGDSAGASVRLKAGVLRSSGLEIYGSGAGTVPIAKVVAAIPEYMKLLANRDIVVEADVMPLAAVEAAWSRPQSGRRLVFTP